MSDQAAEFIGDIPRHYDEGLGPHIFEGFAADLAGRAADLNPSHILELAAGTGIVTRYLRDRLALGAELTATDLNPPMLEHARKKFADGEAVIFKQADAMKLPFDDERFDLIVCQFGVMFFPNKEDSYREARRVLRPGGHYLFNAWGSQADNPFAAITQALLEECFPTDPPGFYRVPFHYHDPHTGLAELQRSGFIEATHREVNLEVEIADTRLFVRGLLEGNPVAEEIAKRATLPLDQIASRLMERLESAFGKNPGHMPLKAHVYLARRPD